MSNTQANPFTRRALLAAAGLGTAAALAGCRDEGTPSTNRSGTPSATPVPAKQPIANMSTVFDPVPVWTAEPTKMQWPTDSPMVAYDGWFYGFGMTNFVQDDADADGFLFAINAADPKQILTSDPFKFQPGNAATNVRVVSDGVSASYGASTLKSTATIFGKVADGKLRTVTRMDGEFTDLGGDLLQIGAGKLTVSAALVAGVWKELTPSAANRQIVNSGNSGKNVVEIHPRTAYADQYDGWVVNGEFVTVPAKGTLGRDYGVARSRGSIVTPTGVWLAWEGPADSFLAHVTWEGKVTPLETPAFSGVDFALAVVTRPAKPGWLMVDSYAVWDDSTGPHIADFGANASYGKPVQISDDKVWLTGADGTPLRQGWTPTAAGIAALPTTTGSVEATLEDGKTTRFAWAVDPKSGRGIMPVDYLPKDLKAVGMPRTLAIVDPAAT